MQRRTFLLTHPPMRGPLSSDQVLGLILLGRNKVIAPYVPCQVSCLYAAMGFSRSSARAQYQLCISVCIGDIAPIVIVVTAAGGAISFVAYGGAQQLNAFHKLRISTQTDFSVRPNRCTIPTNPWSSGEGLQKDSAIGLTVSQMALAKMTDSPQQRQHLLAEHVLNWLGLPTVHVRPTVSIENFFFLAWAAESIARDDTIRLPFGAGRTSPVAVQDVAEVIAIILSNPAAHVGKVYELTGPRSQDMHAVASEYSRALGRSIKYVDVPLEQWRDQELRNRNLPEHVFEHLLTMARLHSANRYDRITQAPFTV